MLNNADTSIILRLKIRNKAGALSSVMAVISHLEGSVGAIDIIHAEKDFLIREITTYMTNQAHADELLEKIKQLEHVEILDVLDRTFLIHQGGKIEVVSKLALKHPEELAMAYTPGVARVCQAIYEQPASAHELTIKKNMVAIVTDGSAILGLGNLGPLAALPVMEGKAMLFKTFANVDAFPLCLNTQDPDEIVETVQRIAPGFGGINLEDISAPRCFEIENRLKQLLDIPVFHDDQHGTAVVLIAAFINALKILGKKAESLKIVVSGVGAAGVACTKMLQTLGAKNIIGCDRRGIVSTSRKDLDETKRAYAMATNPYHEQGSLQQAIRGADVFIGLSGPAILTEDDVKTMNTNAIVFAMANPIPEIMPELALPHVAIMATGRSDYPNQINNVLAFPGIFRGALDCRAREINEAMQMAAAKAIASVVEDENLSPDYIIPSVFNPQVVFKVAEATREMAIATGGCPDRI